MRRQSGRELRIAQELTDRETIGDSQSVAHVKIERGVAELKIQVGITNLACVATFFCRNYAGLRGYGCCTNAATRFQDGHQLPRRALSFSRGFAARGNPLQAEYQSGFADRLR